MAICSYLVIPAAGAGQTLAARLEALPGCEVARAENRDVLLLVTDTAGPEEERALHAALNQLDDLHGLVLTFGEIAAAGDP